MNEKAVSGAGRWVLRVLGAALVGAILIQAVLDASRETFLEEGSQAPDFVLERYSGGSLSSGELRGKVVLLNFWATWCPPCVEEMPSLVKLAKEFEGRGLVFVAANRDEMDHAKAAVTAFSARKLPGVEQYVSFASDPVAFKFRVESLPTTYFIGPDGKVIDAYAGYASETKLRRRIEKALAGK